MFKKIAISFLALIALLMLATALFVSQFDVNRYKPELVKWAQEHTQRTLTIDGSLGLTLFPQLAVTLPHIKLSEHKRHDEFASVQSAQLQLALMPLLSGRIEMGHLQAQGLHVRYRRNAQGQRNIDDLLSIANNTKESNTPPTTPAATANAVPMQLNISAITLRDVTASVHDELTHINGTAKFAVLELGGVADGAQTPVKLDASFNFTAPAVQGRLVSSGSAGYSTSSKTANWDLNGQWAGANYSTRGSTRLGAAVPQVQAQLSLARLNTDQLGATAPVQKSKKKTPTAITSTGGKAIKKGAADSTPVNLSFASAFTGSVDVDIQQLISHGIELQSVQAKLRGNGKQLDVPLLTAQVWGGSIKASANVVPASRSLALKGSVENINVQQAMQALSGRESLSGTGRVQFDLRSSGASVAQLRSNLQGQAQLQLRDGAVKGINLAKILRQAKAALTLRKDDVRASDQTEQTDFANISTSFAVQQGVARSSDLVVTSPLLHVKGQGQIDLGRSNIDYLVHASLSDAAIGQDAGSLSVLRGLQIPVQLSGPFDVLQYHVQWSTVAGAVLKDKLKSKLQNKLEGALGLSNQTPTSGETQPNPQDKLKDALKGLLRR